MLPLVFPVSSHSQRCGPGSTFVAIEGLIDNGTKYIDDALNRGATKIIIAHNVQLTDALRARIKRDGIELEHVENPRRALALLSAQAAGYPAKKLKLIGITGTKGKTTTTFITNTMLQQFGYKTAMISSVYNSIENTILETNMTTPQPDYLHQFFAQCVHHGIEYVVMETAAQAMTFDRITGLEFSVVTFMNLEREHGELYTSMSDYYEAKSNLFNHTGPNTIFIVNADNVYGSNLAETWLKRSIHCKKISMHDTNADFFGIFTPSKNQSTTWHADIKKKYSAEHVSIDYQKFYGIFNGYNIMTAMAIADACGISLSICAQALDKLPSIPGRFERYTLASGAHVIIDYAHTPASFEALFKTIRPMTHTLIVVFGAGGGKDPIKRPLMGNVSATYADRVIITTDNPRFEDAQKIITDIVAGISSDDYKNKVSIILDREEAIIEALQNAPKDSYVLLLGKGPDEYQLVQGQKTFFSEKAIIQHHI